MASFLLKILMCPIGVIVASWIFPNVQFESYVQPIIIGLILAVVGIIMEYMLLRKGTLWISTLLDFAATLIIVYAISNLFVGAEVTLLGAILTSVVITFLEYFNHLWLIRSGKTQKSPA